MSSSQAAALYQKYVITGRRCLGDLNCAVDRNGHGTHCAGTVAGANGGVAKEAIVHAVKVLGDDGAGSNAGIVAAIDYVASEGQRPAILSMSLGCAQPCRSPSEDRAIAAAVAAGVSVVVAAGNSGNTPNPDACDYAPASNLQAITVGSITIDDDTRSGFSSYGTCVDIFAPGSNILSAGHLSDTAGRILSGTSMACPHVAGVAALVLGQRPEMSPAEVTEVIMAQAQNDLVKDPRGSTNKLLNIGNMATALEEPSLEVSTKFRPVVVVVLSVAALLPMVCCLLFYRRYGRFPDPRKASPAELKEDLKVVKEDLQTTYHKVVKTLKRTGEETPPKEEDSKKHEWVERSFLKLSWCNECERFLWGFSKQGFECSVCGIIVCKACSLHGKQICSGSVQGRLADTSRV